MNGKQQQLTGIKTSTCICGCASRAYRTSWEGKPDRYHLECYRCQNITPKFLTLEKAKRFFNLIVTTLNEESRSNIPPLQVVNHGS